MLVYRSLLGSSIRSDYLFETLAGFHSRSLLCKKKLDEAVEASHILQFYYSRFEFQRQRSSTFLITHYQKQKPTTRLDLNALNVLLHIATKFISQLQSRQRLSQSNEPEQLPLNNYIFCRTSHSVDGKKKTSNSAHGKGPFKGNQPKQLQHSNWFFVAHSTSTCILCTESRSKKLARLQHAENPSLTKITK